MSLALAPIFTDHAVLQRDLSIPIWGVASAQATISATIADQSACVRAGEDGRWLLRFAPLPAGGPHELRVSDGTVTVVCTDVLIGEVWICSGQSNMEWSVTQSGQGAQLAPLLEAGLLRLLPVKTPAALGRQTSLTKGWSLPDELELAQFSAVGAWFGTTIARDLKVPVGLIANAWGGTRVQAWMSREALMEDPGGREEIGHYEGYLYTVARGKDGEFLSMADWERRGAPQDTGNRGLAEGWAAPAFDDRDWKTMALPSNWQNHGHAGSGVFWFRRTVIIPAAMRGKALSLRIGAVDKHDDTYVNGERVGGLSWEAGGNSWCTLRSYPVPAKLVAADGSLCIAVRARSHCFHGGLIGPAEAMAVEVDGDTDAKIPLTGDWRYRIEQDWGVVTPPVSIWGPGNPNSPNILFDSRLNPLIPYGIRGVIWYQGESNAAEAPVYARMLPAMIRDWRRAFGQGDFPFLQVQLANFRPTVDQPARSEWAELRDAQAFTARTVPDTHYAVTIDVGDAQDIHPKDKRSVGERLARIALARTYGRSLVPCGPTFLDSVIEAGGRMRCRFDHAVGLKTRDGGPVGHVAIAGLDRRFRWAEARIEGETLVAWHPEIPRPAAVRYAWADNPQAANLANGEGLPAGPFRSDVWPV